MAPPRRDDSVSLPLAGGETQACDLCVNMLPGWGQLDATSLQVSVISGGITNILLKVTPPAGDPKPPVVVRVFGQNTEMIIDREEELRKLLALNTAGFGAQVLAVFANGRVEEFIRGRVVELEEVSIPEMQGKVARRMAQFHLLKDIVPTTESRLWPIMEQWMEVARELKFEDAAKQKKLEDFDLKQFYSDAMSVKEALEGMGAPTVMSHNDLLHANIMVLEDGSLQFIDFEYGCANYRGFDFGNHFNEFAGFDCDYGKYPVPDVQKHYFRQYLQEIGGEEAVTEAGVESLFREANVCALASHLYWGLWALIQAKYSSIDFDYVQYGGLRYAEFKRRKAEFMALAQK